MLWISEMTGRSVRRPRTMGLFTLAAAGAFVLTGLAQAGQISRPIRDTSDRSLTSTGKVLVAVPSDQLGQHRYLYRATRSYHGYPVRCGVDLHGLSDATYVVKRLPTRYRYDSGYDLCQPKSPGWSTYRASDHVASTPSAVRHGDAAVSAPAPAVMPGPMTVIAAGPTKLADLPAAMRNDPWALLHHGRYRDARALFEQRGGGEAPMRAGLALATALSGDLDAGADALAALGGDAAAMRALPIQPALATKLTLLADTLYADRPDARRVLRQMAGADAPGSA